MMKVAFLLLVLAVVAVQHSDAAWLRRVVKRVGNAIKRVIRTVPKLVKVWNKAKQIWEWIKSGKRGLDELDLNQDGQVDVEELSKIIGERKARDLMNELADSSDSIAIEEFERNLRDISELAEENNL